MYPHLLPGDHDHLTCGPHFRLHRCRILQSLLLTDCKRNRIRKSNASYIQNHNAFCTASGARVWSPSVLYWPVRRAIVIIYWQNLIIVAISRTSYTHYRYIHVY